MPLGKPVISIGSAGVFNGATVHNSLYLLIGKTDHYHYEFAHSFYNIAKGASLDLRLIEYEGGHEIPFNLLEKLLSEIME